MQELKQTNKVSVTIREGELFINNLNSVKDMVSEAIISFDNQKMQIKAMDPANVSLLVYDVELSEYEAIDTKIGINIGDLHKCLKDFKKANISLIVEDLEYLKVIVRNGVELVFNLKLLNLEAKEQQIPELTFNTTAIVSYKEFKDVLKSAHKVSESITLITKEENTTDLNICAKGDLSDLEVDLKGTIKGQVAKQSKGRYSIEYLNKFVRSKTEQIKLSWGSDYPLKYDLMNGLYFILAPRVDNE